MKPIDNARMKRGFKALSSVEIECFDNDTYNIRLVGDTTEMYFAISLIAAVKYLASLPSTYQALIPADWAKALAVYRRMSIA